jgi:abortive infection bacteriophage resistance protein
MPYINKALTVDEQIALLASKGLEFEPGELRKSLTSVSYHRLSGYWRPCQVIGKDGNWVFRSGSEFSRIWDSYVFDRQLRLLVFDAIERVEVAIRNDLILNLAIKQGPFGYTDKKNLPNIDAVDKDGNTLYDHATLMSQAKRAYKRELSNFNPDVVEYGHLYPDSNMLLPYWTLLEIVEFGTLSRIVHGLTLEAKSSLAKGYGLKKASILDSWLDTIRSARNTCAHHGRLWNRKNALKPEIPNAKTPEWHVPVDIESVKDRTFGLLTILKYLLSYIAPQSRWVDRLEALFSQHPDIDRRLLGYPENWQECPIWVES